MWFACGFAAATDVTGWDPLFAFHYDYTLEETAGLERERREAPGKGLQPLVLTEPVEVTLSVSADPPRPWHDHIRVVRIESEGEGVVVPHQLMGEVCLVPKLNLGTSGRATPPRRSPSRCTGLRLQRACARAKS